MAPARIEELLCRFENAGADVEAILRRCDPGTRLPVRRIESAAGVPHRVVFDSHTVIETNSTWQLLQKNGQWELIADAVLRLDAVVTLRRTQETFYAGRIAYRGDEIDYCDRQELIERDPFQWMKRLLLKQEKGLLVANPRCASFRVITSRRGR
jgi:hypothetical protein